ncbi:MAG: FeoB-associated Cys-rich membrane protein [Oscillospiraceae bacterium]|nr:FeoB-associated Cys-rich membrane protein [Oscillospiraceae bacterium]
MLLWLQTNIGTLLVTLALIAVVGAIVGKILRDRRAGRRSCGCGSCADCAACGQCRGE